MAIRRVSNNRIRCLKSDVKPTTGIPAICQAYETDTGSLFHYDGTFWWMQSRGPFSEYKQGWMPIGAGTAAGTGIFTTLTAAGTPVFANDNVNGRRLNYPSGAVSGNRSGHRVNASHLMRQWNPKLKARIQLTDTSLHRVYIGLASVGELIGDDPLGTGSAGVVFGIKSGSTNFTIFHNDTAGATVEVSTGVAVDTAVHEIRIVADEANTRFAWKLDAGAYGFLTANIPAATTTLAYHGQGETNEAVAKTWHLYDAYLQSDK